MGGAGRASGSRRNAGPRPRDVYVGLYKIAATGPASGHLYLRRAAETALDGADQRAFYKAAGLALRNLLAVQDRDRVQAVADVVLGRPRYGAPSGDLGTCLLNLGNAFIERGDRVSAEQAWLELKELAQRTRDASVRVAAREPEIHLALLAGRLEQAASLAAGVEALGAELGSLPSFGSSALRVIALAHLGRDQEAQALPLIASPRVRQHFAIVSWWSAMVRTMWRGRCGNDSAT